MVSTLFRDPQAFSSALAALGTLQPQAFGSLNRVETLDSASNYYVETCSLMYRDVWYRTVPKIFNINGEVHAAFKNQEHIII